MPDVENPEPVEGPPPYTARHPAPARHPEALEGPPPHIPPNERFDRSVEFVRRDLKTPLWGKQAQILRSIKRNRRVAVRSCNGSGKTFVAACAVIWWLMAHPNDPAMVVTTAPTQHQVRDLLWREIRNIYYRNTALIGGTLTRTTLELSPRHYATGLSTDSPERFQGFHETNILFVIDEASGVREEVFDAIEGSMTSRRARLLLIGNPTSLAGTFYKAFHQRRTQYKTIHISAFDTPNLLASASSESSLLREGSREGRLQRRPAHASPLASPDSIGTPGANQDRGGVPRRDANIPVAVTSAHSPNSREAANPPPQTGVTTPIPGIVMPKWVYEASTTWGENSAQYQVRVLGQFPTQADDTLIPLTSIEAAISQKSDPTPAHRASDSQSSTKSDDAARPSSLLREGPREGRLQLATKSSDDARSQTPDARPDRTQPIHIGVDVARFGTDRTVICIRQGNHVIALTQHQKLNTMRTTGLVVKAISEYNPQSVRIDEIGIGAGVVDRLHELNYSQVEGVNVGNRATDPEHFFNLRSELYDNLRARFEEGTIVIPNDDDLIGQLAAIRVEYTSRGQLKVEPKETMRRRSLPSPDKADALLLAFAPTPPKNLFRVWT